ncbi:MAG: hypothetical protein IJU74_06495, partial [Bacteroidales bacterium]|nr:hypothetical protein [Bacteroidales bacterium]
SAVQEFPVCGGYRERMWKGSTDSMVHNSFVFQVYSRSKKRSTAKNLTDGWACVKLAMTIASNICWIYTGKGAVQHENTLSERIDL